MKYDREGFANVQSFWMSCPSGQITPVKNPGGRSIVEWAHLRNLTLIDLVQWPAMAVTVLAAWFVGSQRAGRRMIAFWAFGLSNVLWVIWGVHADAYALILLEVTLCAMNLRGFLKNRRAAQQSAN